MSFTFFILLSSNPHHSRLSVSLSLNNFQLVFKERKWHQQQWGRKKDYSCFCDHFCPSKLWGLALALLTVERWSSNFGAVVCSVGSPFVLRETVLFVFWNRLQSARLEDLRPKVKGKS
ncbi:hypothetical protein ACFXTN_001280 [Malus domestica]